MTGLHHKKGQLKKYINGISLHYHLLSLSLAQYKDRILTWIVGRINILWIQDFLLCKTILSIIILISSSSFILLLPLSSRVRLSKECKKSCQISLMEKNMLSTGRPDISSLNQLSIFFKCILFFVLNWNISLFSNLTKKSVCIRIADKYQSF